MTDLVLTKEIAATPAVVFEFLIDSTKLVQWLGVTAEIKPTPGGVFRVNVTDVDTALGEYVEIVTDLRCVFTWGWIDSDDVPPGASTVTIELEPTKTGTRLTMTHAGLPLDAVVGHRAGWRYFIKRLDASARGEANDAIDVSSIGADTEEEVS